MATQLLLTEAKDHIQEDVTTSPGCNRSGIDSSYPGSKPHPITNNPATMNKLRKGRCSHTNPRSSLFDGETEKKSYSTTSDLRTAAFCSLTLYLHSADGACAVLEFF
jgi:hypothetical protein